MVEAYVMIQTGSGTSREILEGIRGLDNVKKANIVAGESDIIAEVEAESEHDLLSLVTDEIQSMRGVGRTRTCIVLE